MPLYLLRDTNVSTIRPYWSGTTLKYNEWNNTITSQSFSTTPSGFVTGTGPDGEGPDPYGPFYLKSRESTKRFIKLINSDTDLYMSYKTRDALEKYGIVISENAPQKNRQEIRATGEAEIKVNKWNETFWPGVPVLVKKSEREGIMRTVTQKDAYALESSDQKFYSYVDCKGFGQCDLSRVEVDHTVDYSPWLKSKNSKPPRRLISKFKIMIGITFIFLLIGIFYSNNLLDTATITMKSTNFSVGYLEQQDKPFKVLKTNPGYNQKVIGVSRFLELMKRYDDRLIESIKTNFHNGSSTENQMASDIEVVLYMPESISIDDIFDHRLEFIFSSRKTRQITQKNQWNYWLIKCNFSYSQLAVLEGYDDGFYDRIYNNDLKERYKSYHTGYVEGEADRKAQKEHRGLQHKPAPK